jgi:hypothetical protein
MPLFRAFKPLVLLLAATAALWPARPARAQEQRCFEQTGHCISGRFLEFWQQNGGLDVFGYPIAPAREERNRDTGKSYLTQWFERNRFELHPENRRPYDVLLGRLGEDTLLKNGRDWRAEYKPETPPGGDCESPSTGGKVFLLCPPFRAYYRAHGLEFDGQPGVSAAESLALFGLPLTQPNTETNASGDTVVTQWFERARMESHPGNPEPYTVLLGLLGNELRGVDRPDSRALPVTIVDRDGVLYETYGATAVRLGTTPNGGPVLDAVQDGERIVLLRERGLQSFAGGRGRELAAFEQGAARSGALTPTGAGLTLYTYARDANSPTGFNGVAGVLQANAARTVRTVPKTMNVIVLE